MYKSDMINLFNDLENLVKQTNENHFGFISRDIKLEDQLYRVYDYGLVGYSAFEAKNAFNCRGTTFNITDINNPILASLPPPKFFNFEEGTINHCEEGNKLLTKMEKLDGSLISTYIHKDRVLLKSKGHLYSSQAVDSNKLLFSEKNKELANEVVDLVKKGYTINFEYTSPKNMIVVIYPEDKLTVLSIRDHKTGEVFFGNEIKNKFSNYKNITNNLVNYSVLNLKSEEIMPFIENAREEKEGEGYVLEIFNQKLNMNILVKAKNKAYVAKHHAKDNINSKKHLLKVILEGASDDLKMMFANSEQMINDITSFEKEVFDKYNEIQFLVNDFYEKNKDLERKNFAIKGKSELPRYLFGPVMQLFVNPEKEIDLKELVFKEREQLFPNIDFSAKNEEEKLNSFHNNNEKEFKKII